MRAKLAVAIALVAVACGAVHVGGGATGSPLSVGQLKFKVMDTVGVPLFCDPDYYPVARMGGEQANEQLFGRLTGVQINLVDLLPGEQQPGLQLQQRRDQDQELGRRFEIKLAAALEMIDVGDHHIGQIDLQQIHLLAEDQRQQEIERSGEDVQIELELADTDPAAARARVEEMCRQLLANPVIENYAIEIG